MISVKGLIKTFASGTRAVDGLDLDVADGEILALLGPNGAGKTTTIRVVSTLAGFDEGQVMVAGFDVDREPDKVRQSIGLVAQQTGVDYFLTGRENLRLQGQLYRLTKAQISQRIAELAEYFELKDSLDNPVMSYSGGMRRKLDIATALIHKPKVIFLDEPTLGLDIKSRQNLWNYIRQLNRELNLTILLTTHYLEEADKLSDQVAIINRGRVCVVDTPEALKSSIHGDAVTLSFAEQTDASRQFGAALGEQPYVERTTWEGKRLHVYVENGAESIAKLANAAAQHGLEVMSITLAHPTLDDVFLKYTGASIEDSSEDAGEEWWTQWAGKGGSGKWQKKWQQSQDDASDAATDGGETDWRKWQQAGSETSPGSASSRPASESSAPNEDWRRWQESGGDKEGGAPNKEVDGQQNWKQWQETPSKSPEGAPDNNSWQDSKNK